LIRSCFLGAIDDTQVPVVDAALESNGAVEKLVAFSLVHFVFVSSPVRQRTPSERQPFGSEFHSLIYHCICSLSSVALLEID
jgi:hypothetical protein